MKIKLLGLICIVFITSQIQAQTLSSINQNISGNVGDQITNRFIYSVGELGSISNFNIPNQQKIGTGFINTISIQKKKPPIIITNPVQQNVCFQDSAEFSVIASSQTVLKYQWQVNKGNGYIDISNSNFYNGALSSKLKIFSTDTSWNNFKYRCIVSNISGSVNSDSAILLVKNKSKINNITGASKICIGSNTKFSNSTIGIRSQWKSSNVNLATVDVNGLVQGISSGTASITYQITDSLGCTSETFTLISINELPKIPKLIKDTLICKATNLILNTEVNMPAKYEWTSVPSGFKSTSSTVNLTNPALYKLKILFDNGCEYFDSINLRNTIDTAILSKILLSSQAYINENVIAVNITNPTPQNIIWNYPSDAQLVSKNDTNLILKFLKIGKYQISLENRSFDVCSSKDSAIIIINNRDSTLNSKEIVLVREVNVGPNPSTGLFNFEIYLNKPGKVSLRIYSFSGSNIYGEIIPEASGVTIINKQVDISGYPKDTYIAIIQTSDGYEIRKLLKI